MITSPINPYRYWKLEEIQSMLNQIEGYENVVIEFQYQQSDNWTTKWDCTYGIKEQLVNGQYNWLLKHRFVFDATSELDARNTAWQEAAERLVTDVWRTSIHSFRKEQRELNKPKAPKTLSENDLKIIDEINKMTEKSWWTETRLWITSGIITAAILLSVLFFAKVLLVICLISLGVMFVGALAALIRMLIKEIINWDEE
jgi:hypothetical protein